MQGRICYEQVVVPGDCSFLLRYDEETTVNILKLHQHPEMEFQFTYSGHGIRTIGAVSEPFKEMEVVFIPANVPHTWVYDQGTRFQEYSLQFSKEAVMSGLRHIPEFGRLAEMIDSMDKPFEILGDCAKTISGLMMKMTAMKPERRIMAFLEILITVLDCSSIRNIMIDDDTDTSTASKDKIKKVMSYMENHLESNLTLSSMSNEFSMGNTAFCNFFKRSTGKTFSFALNEMRISKACMLLTSHTHMSIESIGYSVGFSNHSHFCHTFRRFRGCSPGEYRLRGQQY